MILKLSKIRKSIGKTDILIHNPKTKIFQKILFCALKMGCYLKYTVRIYLNATIKLNTKLIRVI